MITSSSLYWTKVSDDEELKEARRQETQPRQPPNFGSLHKGGTCISFILTRSGWSHIARRIAAFRPLRKPSTAYDEPGALVEVNRHQTKIACTHTVGSCSLGLRQTRSNRPSTSLPRRETRSDRIHKPLQALIDPLALLSQPIAPHKPPTQSQHKDDDQDITPIFH